MTDLESGQREMRELEAVVESAFRDAGSLGPLPVDGYTRCSLLRLSVRPSFDNYRCWTVWGPAEAPANSHPPAFVRRIVWRRDLDGDRGNPMRRVQRLGQALRPTLEVADAMFEAADLHPMARTRPRVDAPVDRMLAPRSLALDGERYALEVDAGTTRWSYEWLGVNMDWTSARMEEAPIASWAVQLRDLLDKVIAAYKPPQK